VRRYLGSILILLWDRFKCELPGMLKKSTIRCIEIGYRVRLCI
jgi:hypothetical protein